MAEVQVTRWREIPSMVTARDAYLEGWSRDPWSDVAGSATQAAEAVSADLEDRWSAEAIMSLLDSYGPGTSGDDA
jgi:hypothetical protein